MRVGPNGFASVVYRLLVPEAGISQASELSHLIALVIFLPILTRSSSDDVVVKKHDERQPHPWPQSAGDRGHRRQRKRF